MKRILLVVALVGSACINASGPSEHREKRTHYRKLPVLAQATSIRSWTERIKDFFNTEDRIVPDRSQVILNQDLTDYRTKRLTQSIISAAENDFPFTHCLMYGPSGTGKTLLANVMAHESGLEYIYVNVDSLQTYSVEEGCEHLRYLFEYAQAYPKKVMIIIDDGIDMGDSVFAHGSPGAPCSDKNRTLLNVMLEYMEQEQNEYCVMTLTYRPEAVDDAFLSCCWERIKIDVPGPAERRKILQLHVDKLLKNGENLKPHKPSIFSTKYWFGKDVKMDLPTIADGALSDEALDRLSDKLKGFVGRDISKLVIEIQGSALSTEENRITPALINRVVDTKLAEREEASKGFIHDGVTTEVPKS